MVHLGIRKTLLESNANLSYTFRMLKEVTIFGASVPY